MIIANCSQVIVLLAVSGIGKNYVCSFGFLSDHCALVLPQQKQLSGFSGSCFPSYDAAVFRNAVSV
jgi:hypothetical protein